MSESAELRFEAVPSAKVEELSEAAFKVFIEDVSTKGLDVPPYNKRVVSIAAKAADGQIVGGFVATTAWNEFRIEAVAVNPHVRVRRTGTTLMRWAEQLARTEYTCNRICLEVFDWQSRGFFEGFGFRTVAIQPNYPRGHTAYTLEKVWTAATSGDAPAGHGETAAHLTMAPWEAQEATARLREWCHANAQAWATPSVPPFTPKTVAWRGLGADGSQWICIIGTVEWNRFHLNILTVSPHVQRRRLGTTALRKVEELAREHGCDWVVLETMTWQARPFYEKNGFAHFGTQLDIPIGHGRYLLMKRLCETTKGHDPHAGSCPVVPDIRSSL